MLKRLLLVTLALMLVLGLSGVGLAHYCSITQDSAEYNFAFVGQYSTGDNEVDICQDATQVNATVVVQQGIVCDAEVGQSACFLNFALVEQSDGALYDVLTIEEKIDELVGMYEDWCDTCP
jgi:hypothetical protein